MKNSIILFSFYFATAIMFCSCKKDDDDVTKPQVTNENELITTMKLVMTEAGNPSHEQVFVSRDLDGTGPGLLTIDTIRLVNGVTYNTEILLLDETKNPVDTISKEVEEEGDEHLMILSPTWPADITIIRTDTDVNGVVIGLKSTFKGNAVTTDKNGKVRIVLKHQGEDKTKDPNVAPDPQPGTTDIDVHFPVIIQ